MGSHHRRWLLKANPRLADLITEAIGDGWVTDLERLRKLEEFLERQGVPQAFRKVKQEN